MAGPDRVREVMLHLRRQTNGAASGAMSERGLEYAVNYGITVAAVREVARAYAPDHALAKELYTQPSREARLAGLYIADPGQLTLDDAVFWAAGITNSELAQHFAFALGGRSAVAGSIAQQWLASGNENLRYAALMTGARYFTLSDDLVSWDFARIDALLCDVVRTDSRQIWNGAVAFTERFFRARGEERASLLPGLRVALDEDCEGARYISEELSWRLEEI